MPSIICLELICSRCGQAIPKDVKLNDVPMWMGVADQIVCEKCDPYGNWEQRAKEIYENRTQKAP